MNFAGAVNQKRAGNLAGMGRGGDTALAHMTPGEVVIPESILQENPGLIQAISQALQARGANPRDFVVGAPEGNVNPETGLEEFGFIRKLLSFAAPVVGTLFGGPIGGALGIGATGGAAVGGALGGGLGSAIGGGNIARGVIGGGLGGAAGNLVGGALGGGLGGTIGGGVAGGAVSGGITGGGRGALQGAALGGLGGGISHAFAPSPTGPQSRFASQPQGAQIGAARGGTGGGTITGGLGGGSGGGDFGGGGGFTSPGGDMWNWPGQISPQELFSATPQQSTYAPAYVPSWQPSDMSYLGGVPGQFGGAGGGLSAPSATTTPLAQPSGQPTTAFDVSSPLAEQLAPSGAQQLGGQTPGESELPTIRRTTSTQVPQTASGELQFPQLPGSQPQGPQSFLDRLSATLKNNQGLLAAGTALGSLAGGGGGRGRAPEVQLPPAFAQLSTQLNPADQAMDRFQPPQPPGPQPLGPQQQIGSVGEQAPRTGTLEPQQAAEIANLLGVSNDPIQARAQIATYALNSNDTSWRSWEAAALWEDLLSKSYSPSPGLLDIERQYMAEVLGFGQQAYAGEDPQAQALAMTGAPIRRSAQRV